MRIGRTSQKTRGYCLMVVFLATLGFGCEWGGVPLDTHVMDQRAPQVELEPRPLPAPKTTAPRPDLEVRAAQDSVVQKPAPPEVRLPAVDDLLRLPSSVRAAHEAPRAAAAPLERPAVPQSEPALRFDVETHSEAATLDPRRERTDTDARVSIRVSEGTRVQGGVRIGQESGVPRDEPIPTVGVERRF